MCYTLKSDGSEGQNDTRVDKLLSISPLLQSTLSKSYLLEMLKKQGH